MDNSKILDKYYTKPEVAKQLIVKLNSILDIPQDSCFLEPSAESESFLKWINNNYEAYDILPESNKFNIIKGGFLIVDLPRTDYIAIGNPPFGKRSSLAIDFFNKCAKYSNVIAMIFPFNFSK